MSFRLSDEATAIIRRGEDEKGITRSAVLELALRLWAEHDLKPEAGGKPKKKSRKPP